MRTIKRFLDDGGQNVAADQRKRALQATADIHAVTAKVTIAVAGKPAAIYGKR